MPQAEGESKALAPLARYRRFTTPRGGFFNPFLASSPASGCAMAGKLRPWAVAGLATIVAYLLQISPFPGLIIMLLGGPLWVSLGIQATVLLFAADCLRGRLPRAWLALPVAFHAIGPALFLASAADAWRLRGALAAEEARYVFDPARHDILLGAGADHTARELIGAYRLESVYLEPVHNSAAYTRWRFEPACDRRAERQDDIQAQGRTIAGACATRLAARPARPAIVFQFAAEDKARSFINARIFRVTAQAPDGARAAGAAAHVELYSPLTWPYAGCWMESKSGPYECRAGFPRFEYEIGAPSRISDATMAALIGRVLNLTPRALAETPAGLAIADQPRS